MKIESKKYQVIYADPPWHYGNKIDKFLNDLSVRKYRTKKGTSYLQPENNYPTLKIEDICNLPIKKLIDDNAVCFMWSTSAHLDQAIKVMQSWGFTYKSIGFIWIKEYPSGELRTIPSPWTNQQGEICLFGTKGSMHKKRKDTTIKQVIKHPPGKHSTKPQEAADRIVRMFPDCTRIELFARDAKPGWDVWGNEIQNTIEL